jgi:hypothetical protein
MPTRHFDSHNLKKDEDWDGNNAVFKCPLCAKVFLVSGMIHRSPEGERGFRRCPGCGNSIGHVTGGRKSGGTASIEWN